MRVLVVTPLSVGLVHPMIGIGLELAALGHDIVFASASPVLENLPRGFKSVPPPSAEHDRAMIIDLWLTPDKIPLQVAYVRSTLRAVRPDVMLASTFALGGLLAAQVEGVPVAVLGLGTWMWPADGPEPNQVIASNRKNRVADVLRRMPAVRAASGLPDGDDMAALIGDVFLLQSAPPLAWPTDRLPHRVLSVGACLWEPPAHDPDLDRFLDAAAGGTIVYAQPGRNFGQEGFWRPLVDALRDTACRVVAAVSRLDGGPGELPSTGFFVRQHIPQGVVLPRASIVVTTGHTTSFLGAAYAGVPMLMAPQGSGSTDIADLAQHLGISLTLYVERLDAAAMRNVIARVLGDAAMLARSAEIARALGPMDGCRRAAEACVALSRR